MSIYYLVVALKLVITFHVGIVIILFKIDCHLIMGIQLSMEQKMISIGCCHKRRCNVKATKQLVILWRKSINFKQSLSYPFP